MPQAGLSIPSKFTLKRTLTIPPFIKGGPSNSHSRNTVNKSDAYHILTAFTWLSGFPFAMEARRWCYR